MPIPPFPSSLHSDSDCTPLRSLATQLVNSWTLDVMTPAQTASCTSTSGATSGDVAVPCPPSTRSATLWWEDNTHHRLHNLKWVEGFEAKAATLKRLVLSVGGEWWQQYLYGSATGGGSCASPGGVMDAFTPLTALDLGNAVYETIWRTCDPFEVKYPIAVANIARYLNSVQAFKGHVIFVTQPPGIKGCETVSTPNAKPSTAASGESNIKSRRFWYDSNAVNRIGDGAGGLHYFGRLRDAERHWKEAFAKHAPRLKLTVLNVTAMSDMRSDARVRDGDCAKFCYPGVPHHQAEMLLRLLEQQVHGNTNGLY